MNARIPSTDSTAEASIVVAPAATPRALGKTLSRLALAVAVQSLPVPGGFAVLALDGWGAMLQLLLAPIPMARGHVLVVSVARLARRLRRPGSMPQAATPCHARRA